MSVKYKNCIHSLPVHSFLIMTKNKSSSRFFGPYLYAYEYGSHNRKFLYIIKIYKKSEYNKEYDI